MELSGLKVLPLNFAVRGAYTLMSAKYDQATSVSAGAVNGGNKLPCIPQSQLYVDIAWRSADWLSKPKVTYTELGLDYRTIGKMYANSLNTEAANSYRLLGARASHNIKGGPHTVSFFGRVDNLTDKVYVSSVVVDQQFGAYYESGMPRNWILGIKYSLAIN
jgi:iron complex outermembrane receptor protein